ncbi:MAG: cysteine peptidase family C39 domain-containing protein [Candidatus Saccharimonadia bacterium]
MKAIEHTIKHYYQPTNDSCGYAALSMLVSSYGLEVTPDQLLKNAPKNIVDGEEAWGSVTAQLATWCIERGFEVELWMFDFLIIDLSWQKLSPSEIIFRLKAIENVREIPSLGKWTKVYIQRYIEFFEAGGQMNIRPHVTTELINKLLEKGPVYANVCTKPLYNTGRMSYPALRQEQLDDVHGHVGTHSLVIYGRNEAEDYLLADPWNGLTQVDPESLLCGITAAEIECDAMIFQVKK